MDAQRFTDALVEELRVARTRSRLTNREIAEGSGLSESTVNRILLGQRTPDVLQLLALTRALRADLRTLIDTAWTTASDDNVTYVEHWGQAPQGRMASTEALVADILASEDKAAQTSDQDMHTLDDDNR